MLNIIKTGSNGSCSIDKLQLGALMYMGMNKYSYILVCALEILIGRKHT